MATPTSYGDLRSDVDNLAGVALTADERDRYLNQANVELCVRAGWTKDTLSFGPTVADQPLYDLPANFRKPADFLVTVGERDYGPADPATVRDIRRRRRALVGDGVWWIDYEAGARKLGIFPVPSGVAIQMLCVVTPPPLVADDDEPSVPWDFRSALIHYVRATALGFAEDDPEGQDAGFGAFEQEVARLRALVTEIESGDGPIQLMARGVHW